MKKMFLILGTLLIANSGVYAQKKVGDVVSYETQGMSYKITNITCALDTAADDISSSSASSIEGLYEGNLSLNINYNVTGTRRYEVQPVAVMSDESAPTIAKYQDPYTTKIADESNGSTVVTAWDCDTTWLITPPTGKYNSDDYEEDVDYELTSNNSLYLYYGAMLSKYFGSASVYFTTVGEFHDALPSQKISAQTWNDEEELYEYQKYSYDELINDFGADDDWILYVKKTTKKGNTTYSVYLIESINVSVSINTNVNVTDTYAPTSIPGCDEDGNSTVDWGDATDLTIGASVKTIGDGAFAGSKIGKFSVSGSAYYTDNGTFLYTYDEDSLVALGAKVAAGSYTIPESVSTIVDYAMENVSDVTLISSNVNLEYDILGGTGNSVDKPAATLTLSEQKALAYVDYASTLTADCVTFLNPSSSANEAYGVTVEAGSRLTHDNVASLMSTLQGMSYAAGLCYVDLSSCAASSDLGEISIDGLNPNCLVYLPAGVTATGTNVVIGNTCETLSLSRATGNPFYNIKKFSAAIASVEGLPISNNYTMITLPFSIGSDNNVTTDAGTTGHAVDLMRICRLNSYDTESNTYTFAIAYSGGFDSNTPYLVNSYDRDDESVSISSITTEDVTVQTTASSLSYAINGVTFKGTYQSVCGNTNKYTCYGMSSGKFLKAKATNSFKPFSGFIYTKNAEASEAKIRFIDDEETLDMADNVNSVVNDKDNVNVSVDNSSIVISAKSATKVCVATVSGAIIFHGAVSGTKTIKVNKGVYIVNGNKYIVK